MAVQQDPLPNPLNIGATERPSTGWKRVQGVDGVTQLVTVLDTDTDYTLTEVDENFYLGPNRSYDVLLSGGQTPDQLPDPSRFGFVR